MVDDTPQSLGEFLRLERERRSITLEQVASATKISIKVLQSLESDHYRDLPAKTFIRGFVTAYCRFVGLNAREVLSRYDGFIDSRSLERPKRDSGHSGYAFERKEGEQTKTILWIIMGSFIVFGGLVILIMKPNFHRSRHSKQGAPRAIASPVAQPSSAPSPHSSHAPTIVPAVSPSMAPSSQSAPSAPTPVPSPSPRMDPPEPLNNGSSVPVKEVRYKGIFRALEDIWVRYRVDDRVPMKFPIRKGGVLVLKARERFIFQVSNAASVTYSLNGRAAKPLLEEKNLTQKQSNATLGVPAQQFETIAEPFPGQKPLPATVPPKQGAASQASPESQ